MFRSPRPSDSYIIGRVLKGSRDEFGLLVERYLPAVHALAYAQTGNIADSEDMVQEALLKAFLSLNTLREPSKFGAWLLAIARNVCASHGRARQRQKTLVETLPEGELTHPGDEMARKELRQLLRREIDDLEESHREVLLLHYYAGKSTREIAELLEISRESAKKQLQRAREKLGNRLLDVIHSAVDCEHSLKKRTGQVMGAVAVAAASWEGAASTVSGNVAVAESVKAFGGLLLMKKVAAIVVPLLLVFAGWWALNRQNTPSPEALQQTPLLAQEEVDSQLADNISQPVKEETELSEETQEELVLVTALRELATAEEKAVSEAEKGAGTVIAPPTVGRPMGQVIGVVRHENERPVAGAEVSISRIAYGPGKLIASVDYVEKTQTDEEGRFAFNGLPVRLELPEKDGFLVSATSGDLVGRRQATAFPFWGAQVELILRRASVIAGKVMDARGRPVEGAIIHPVEYRGPHNKVDGAVFRFFFFAGAVNSDENGRFVLPQLWEDQWRLFVEADGYAPCWTDYVPIGAEDVVVVLNDGQAVEGTVVEAGMGQALAGVGIVLAHKEDTHRHHVETVTDDIGRFRLAHLRPGSYWLRIEDDKWVPDGAVVKFDIRDGSEPLPIVVPARLGAVVEGQVYSAENGNGIAGVTIAAFPGAGRVGPFASSSSYYVAASDANGRYRLTGLSEAEYRFDIVKDGVPRLDFSTAPRRSLVANTVTELDFPLPTRSVLSGRVIDGDGRPVDGVQLETVGPDGILTVSRRDGTFQFSGLKTQREVVIVATKWGFAMAPVGPLAVPEGGLHDVTITLEPAARIDGLVVGTSGRPIADAGITARAVNAVTRFRGGYHTRSDKRGRFILEGLHSGDYELLGTPPGTQHYGGNNIIARVTLEPGEHKRDTRAVYPQGANLSISGTVVDMSGIRGAGPAVECTGPVFRVVQAERNNSFRLAGLEPGVYLVKATHHLMGSRESEAIWVEAGASDVRLVLPDYSMVAAQVTNAVDGAFVPDTRFKCAAGIQHWLSPEVMWLDVRASQEEEKYLLRFIPARELTLAVSAPGFAPELVHLTELEPGKTMADLQVRLHTAMTLEGTIRDAEGHAIRGARVIPGPLLSESLATRTEAAKTGWRGKFQLENLGPDPQVVTVYHPDFAPASIEVKPGPPDLTTLYEGGAVEGYVMVDGVPCVDKTVFVEVDGYRLKHTSTDKSGWFRLDRIPTGKVLLTAGLAWNPTPYNKSRRLRTPVMIKNSSTTEVNLLSTNGTAALEGSVIMSEELKAFPSVTVHTRGEWDVELAETMTVPYDGFYRFEGLSAGSATLDVKVWSPNGEQTVWTQEIELKPNEVLVCDPPVQ